MSGLATKYCFIKSMVMNKTLIALLVLIGGCHLISLAGVWWLFILIPFLVFLIPNFKTLNAFWISFLAVFILWLVYSIWLNMGDSFNLGNKIGELFGGLPGLILIFLGCTIAGLLAGLAGWIGCELRKSLSF